MTTTLLALDDSKTMRKVIELTFAGQAYRTVLSDSPADALSKLRSESPTVALVDAGLDGTDGYAVCKQMKQAAPGIGVIVLSSKQQPYDRVRGSAAGADDYIDKPFDTQQLLDKVEALTRAVASRAGKPAAPAPREPAVLAPAWAPPQESSPELEVVEDDELLDADIADYEAPAPAAPAPARGGPRAPAQPAARAPLAAAGPTAAALEQRLNGLGLSAEQVQAVLALSREVVEQVVWEVVPALAETLIQEEIRRLTQD